MALRGGETLPTGRRPDEKWALIVNKAQGDNKIKIKKASPPRSAFPPPQMCCVRFGAAPHQYDLMILQKATSQHIFRLPWCSCRSPDEHLEGSTSQFSSDSYRALMNSPEESRGRHGLRTLLKKRFSAESIFASAQGPALTCGDQKRLSNFEESRELRIKLAK